MRLVVMGSGPFAVPMFEGLLAAPGEFRVAALITRPPHGAGRRGQPPPNPMREAAARHGLPTHDPESVNAPASHDLLRGLGADCFVVCDYGQILRADTLALAGRGGLNLHGSLLPKYRGAAPIQWAIYHGETETGVSVIHMTPRLDGGPIVVARPLSIHPDETAAELEPRLAALGASAVRDALTLLKRWDGAAPLGAPQNPALATKAPRLRKDEGAIDWRRDAPQLERQVRAFQPWPGSFTHWRREGAEPLRLILERVALARDEATGEPLAADAAPGTVVSRRHDELLVAAGGGVLRVTRLRPAGKRAMDAAEFLRGHPLRAGQTLS